MKKIWRLFLLTVLFLLPLAACNSDSDGVPLKVVIEAEGISETILPTWEEDGCTLYLPSYSQRADLDIIAGSNVYIENVRAKKAEAYLVDGIYSLRIGKEEYRLTVYTSANTGTIWIDTDSKKMDDIYADPSYKERIDIAVFTGEGTLDYKGSEDKLKLRGNSTRKLEKKPFNLKLDEKASILGLRASKDFALLANGYDRSGLRDVVYKSIAQKMGFPYTPDTEYVDVYLNGEYNGLYVLSEKISVSEEYLDLQEGSWLCAIELTNNMKDGDIYVNSILQDIFEIAYPKEPAEQELEEIEGILNAFERALLAEDGIDPETGRAWDACIDFETWAKAYIVDEVLANVDSSLASSYMYYNAADGRLYKGPIWDGDRTLGNQSSSADPKTLMACQGHGYNGKPTVFYSLLMEKEEFREKVIAVYKEFDFDSLINDTIDELSGSMETAKAMDTVRWSSLYDQLEERLGTTVVTVEEIKEYVSARVEFLDEILPHYEDYAVIYLYESGVTYSFTTVRKGDLYIPQDDSASYKDIDSGEVIDFSQPISRNLAITAADD